MPEKPSQSENESHQKPREAALNELHKLAEHQEWEQVIERGTQLLENGKYARDDWTRAKIEAQINQAQEVKGVAL